MQKRKLNWICDCPENWVMRADQDQCELCEAWNPRTKSKLITIDGLVKSPKAWAKFYGLSPVRFAYLFKNGLELKPRAQKTLKIQGITRTYKEWATEFGITYTTFYNRLRRGQDLETGAPLT